MPAYRNAKLYSELHFENYIPSVLEEQYPGFDIKKILKDVEEKKAVFHQVLGPEAPFTLTAHECLLTVHQYKWHIIIQDAKAKEILQEVAREDSQQTLEARVQLK